MDCYITSTGSFLPGEAIANADLPDYLGELEHESEIREKILRMNGIKKRHYALDKNQNATHDVYELAALAVENCIAKRRPGHPITYLSAGSTNAPLVGPGIASILHGRLAEKGLLDNPVEINSNSGICTSAAQAFVNACRAVESGAHETTLCVGTEHPSEILKSKAIHPPEYPTDNPGDVKKSRWFMSVFLRFMLSDGAGAFLLQNRPGDTGVSFKVNWTSSRSFANAAPLCMKLDGKSLLLSQDVGILAEWLKPCVRKMVAGAFESNRDSLENYKTVLPHLSSFFFRRYLLKVLKEFNGDGKEVNYWTNLEWAGNTGAASIYIMLDEYSKVHDLKDGEKLILFIPESGRFNFVIISLTVAR